MAIFTSFIAGLIFGLGLILSGMTNPKKIIDFLDISGQWDPSLLFVMLGALAVSVMAFRFARKRAKTYLDLDLQLPSARQIDRKLVIGSITFGAGWGIAGYCPGPAMTSLLTGQLEPAVFVLAVLAGMGIHAWIESKR
jgi:uncharacterized protein